MNDCDFIIQKIKDKLESINLNIGNNLKLKLLSIIRKGLSEKWLINIEELNIKKEILTTGCNSKIYDCEWRGLDIILKCIKKFNIKYLQEFINEINIFSTIRHPNAVEFLGLSIDIENLKIYILMEKINGDTLSNLLDKRIIKNNDKIVIIKNIYNILFFLHNCKPSIIYRDLKPDNIMIYDNNKVKLLDFGLSKFIPENNSYKLSGDTGTLRYMAPEVYLKKNYYLEVDIYSFGLVIYYIYKNEKPFLDYNKKNLDNYFNKQQDFKLNIKNKKIKDLISGCINFDIKQRSKLIQINDKLKNISKYDFGFFTFY